MGSLSLLMRTVLRSLNDNLSQEQGGDQRFCHFGEGGGAGDQYLVDIPQKLNIFCPLILGTPLALRRADEWVHR